MINKQEIPRKGEEVLGYTGKRGGGLIVFMLIIVLLTVAYTFIMQKTYTKNALNTEVDRDTTSSDAIHVLVNNRLDREDFSETASETDMQTERYKEIQKYLNEIRNLNSTRYFYTATRNDEGRLIYLVDGLELGSSDFRKPGDYIEDEMITYIERALAGEIVYSQDIVDTTWGPIFTACYPVVANDDPESVIGALCIEMDMASVYGLVKKNNHDSIIMALVAMLVLIILCFSAYDTYQRQKKTLADAAMAADSANKAKSTFLFNMSHDIRTPMNAIIGYAELAEGHLKEPALLEDHMKKIRSCGERMLSILDNVLELSRIENGKVILEETVLNISDALDSITDMFFKALDEKKQVLTVTKSIQFPYVYMDEPHMSEIFLNILSNAVKYTGNGGRITCDLKQYPHERDGWCMTEFVVTDTGIGMSDEFQAHIFEFFSRERNSTVSGIEGSGLGMGIVKQLVDLMDGTIEVKSRQGKGSRFTIRVPLRIASEAEMQPKRAETIETDASFTGKRILLAEDNDLNAEIAIELLQEQGLIVERAENGVVCLDMLEKAEPDRYSLILMDIQMPEMNGYDAAKKIRRLSDKSKANIPIIAMTANAFAEDKSEALSVGMNAHVAKPINMNILLATLREYLL